MIGQHILHCVRVGSKPGAEICRAVDSRPRVSSDPGGGVHRSWRGRQQQPYSELLKQRNVTDGEGSRGLGKLKAVRLDRVGAGVLHYLTVVVRIGIGGDHMSQILPDPIGVDRNALLRPDGGHTQ
jgi:hypothetical protein